MTEQEKRLRALLGRGPASGSQTTYGDVPPLDKTQAQTILGDHFKIADWKGLDNHICEVCSVGFLDTKTAVEHWSVEHSGWTPPPDTDTVDTGLVSATGNRILKQIEVPPDHDKEIEE